jgi:hypothetical protein
VDTPARHTHSLPLVKCQSRADTSDPDGEFKNKNLVMRLKASQALVALLRE